MQEILDPSILALLNQFGIPGTVIAAVGYLGKKALEEVTGELKAMRLELARQNDKLDLLLIKRVTSPEAPQREEYTQATMPEPLPLSKLSWDNKTGWSYQGVPYVQSGITRMPNGDPAYVPDRQSKAWRELPLSPIPAGV